MRVAYVRRKQCTKLRSSDRHRKRTTARTSVIEAATAEDEDEDEDEYEYEHA